MPQAAANAPDDAVAGVVLINCAGGMNNKVLYHCSAFDMHRHFLLGWAVQVDYRSKQGTRSA